MKEKKYTVDDTFRVLARPSYEEMVRLHREWAPIGTAFPHGTQANIPFMKHYGWTWLEFMQEGKRRREIGAPYL